MDVKRLFAQFNFNEPATSRALQQVERDSEFQLPAEYQQFFKMANGGEGFVASEYLILWPVEELLTVNEAYETAKYAPELFLFGSNGGGEAFAFDKRSRNSIVAVPFVGMDISLAEPQARDFQKFIEQLNESQERSNRQVSTPNSYAGKEIFEIKPVILGGSPTDPANKTVLTRQQHIQTVRYWNKVINELRQHGAQCK